MLKTLRNRLIFSHILPLLIIIPLMGVALISVLESLVYLPSLSKELVSDAQLLSSLAADEYQRFQDPVQAQAFLNKRLSNNNERVMLLDANGVLLASTDPADNSTKGQSLNLREVETALQGQVVDKIHYSNRLNADVIDVFVPVTSNTKQVIGVIRMTYQFASIADDFYQLRFLISGLLIFALLIGSSIGYILAISIETPIRDVTQAVSELAQGSRSQLLKEQGPEETMRLAQAVNFLVTRLRDFENSRRHLLSNLVHELGNPLGALRSAIQALKRGAERDPQLYEELVTGMDKEAERLQRLLEDLAQLHDQVLGTLELDQQAIHLSIWLPSTLRPWEEAAREKNLNWEENIAPDLPQIKGDPVRLAQVLGNLINNAIKFTPSYGKVKVQALPENTGVVIRICDTGPGISKEEQEQIFRPFYRGTQGRRFPQGMGLGLSITQSLVEAHGGRLEVESTPGQGSCFIVHLPHHKTSRAA